MPYSVTYSEEGIICVTVEGHLDIKLLRDIASDVADLCKLHNCRLVLNDLREASLPDSAGEVYFMPREAARSGVSVGIKRALLVNREEDEVYKFMETVFVNQGNSVKIFHDRATAMHWLLDE